MGNECFIPNLFVVTVLQIKHSTDLSFHFSWEILLIFKAFAIKYENRVYTEESYSVDSICNGKYSHAPLYEEIMVMSFERVKVRRKERK